MSHKIGWVDYSRIDLTFSLVNEVDAWKAVEGAKMALGSRGWTLRSGLGGWLGVEETSHTFTFVGERMLSSAETVFEVLTRDHGCVSVQVEFWIARDYRVEEWIRDE